MNLNFFGSSVVRSVEFLSANETPDLMSNFLLNVGGLHLIASGATGFLAFDFAGFESHFPYSYAWL